MFCLSTPSFDYNDAELAGMRGGKNRFDPLLLVPAVDSVREGRFVNLLPECFISGYRGVGKPLPPPDLEFLERAWSVIAK